MRKKISPPFSASQLRVILNEWSERIPATHPVEAYIGGGAALILSAESQAPLRKISRRAADIDYYAVGPHALIHATQKEVTRQRLAGLDESHPAPHITVFDFLSNQFIKPFANNGRGHFSIRNDLVSSNSSGLTVWVLGTKEQLALKTVAAFAAIAHREKLQEDLDDCSEKVLRNAEISVLKASTDISLLSTMSGVKGIEGLKENLNNHRHIIDQIYDGFENIPELRTPWNSLAKTLSINAPRF